jgi:hypothetical protein
LRIVYPQLSVCGQHVKSGGNLGQDVDQMHDLLLRSSIAGSVRR